MLLSQIDFPLISEKMYRLFLIASVYVVFVHSDEHEYRLINDLLNPIHYNPLERPVENNSMPVKVTLSIVLQQLVGLVCNMQILVNSIVDRFYYF